MCHFLWNAIRLSGIFSGATESDALGTRVVLSAKEYRAYADECLGWAKTARNERERAILLEMAKTWTAAALIAKKRAASSKPISHRTQSKSDKDDSASA